jgi:hypothetical protein
MVPSGYWTKEKIKSIANTWNKPIEATVNEMHLTEILPAEYKPVNIEDVIKEQTHLSVEEKEQLQNVLFEFQDLFKGQCGKYNGDPVSLELIPGSKPYYGKPFSIPKAYEQVTKDEIKRLESLEILKPIASSEWAAPTFIIPKKKQHGSRYHRLPWSQQVPRSEAIPHSENTQYISRIRKISIRNDD